MKPLHGVLAAGLLTGAGLLVFGDRQASSEMAQPVDRKPQTPLPRAVAGERPAAGGSVAVAAAKEVATTAATATATTVAATSDAAGPTLMPLRDRTAAVAEGRTGRRSEQLFSAQSWAPPPAAAKVVISAPAAPVAPPLPFAYVGRQSRGGPVEVILSQGDKTLILQEGSVIDGRYRVEAIAPTAVSLRFLPLNLLQQIAIRTTD